MDEQMIAAMVVAVKGELIGCCKSQTADGRGTDWDELARAAVGAAHSVIAGKVAELLDREFAKLPNYRGPDAPCDDLVEQGYGNALTNIRAALAPYPERRSEHHE